MSQGIATVVFALGILGLFWLDRHQKSRAFPALWIPVAWVVLAASRGVSQWLQLGPVVESPEQYLEGSPIDLVVFAGLLVGGVMVLLTRGRRVGPLLRANGPLLVFFLYCAASVLWSDYPVVAFKRWTKAVGNLVMVLVVLTDPDPPSAVKRLLARSGFLLIPLSVLFIKYIPDLGRRYDTTLWAPVYVGVTDNKNSLGVVCLVFGLGSLWRCLGALYGAERPRLAGPMIAHGALLAMALWLFSKANSATSLGCFLVGGALIAVTRRFTLRPRAVHILAVGLVSLCLFGLLLAPATGLVQAMGRDPTLTGRTQLWEEVLRMGVDPWFGAGFESFWLGKRAELLWETYWWHPNEAHNGYLEIFLTLGWLGVALFSFVLVWGYRNVVGSLRRSRELGSVRLAYFMVAVIYNVTEAAFKVMHPVWIMFILAILATPVAVRRPQFDRETRTPQENRAASV